MAKQSDENFDAAPADDERDSDALRSAKREAQREAQETIRPGMILGDQYRIIAVAGKGKMGEVWEAFDMVADRTVAIKFVSPELMRDKDAMRLVKRNFQAIHMLNHQYICPLYALSSDDRFGYFLVMKWMPDTLGDLVSKETKAGEPLPLKMARTVISNLSEALDYAHHNGVIHRDIKPQNIAVTYNAKDEFQNASLIDFGLSSGMNRMEKSTFVLIPDKDDKDSSYTSGTPVYMPPEQWNGQAQDRRTDQYSLAVVAYELLAGHPPFSNYDTNVLRTSVINDMPEPIPSLPRYINAALLKALSKKKEDRFSSCTEFANALGDSQWQHHRRNRVLKIAAAVLLVVGVIFAIKNAGRPQVSDSQLIKIQKAFEQDSYTSTLQSAIDDRSVGPEILPGLCIGGKDYADSSRSYEGDGWKYSYDPKSETGTLTLSGYDGPIITSKGVNLKIVVADGTVNQITSSEQDDAISVSKGDLRIEGGEQGTGRLTIRVNRAEKSYTANGIGINTAGKNLEIARLAELNIEAPQSMDGIMVCAGEISFKEIKKLHISAIKNGNAVTALSDMTIGGNKEDVYVFDGAICLRGEVFFNKSDDGMGSVPTVDLSILGKKIDYCVNTFTEIVRAFDDVSDDTVILLTGNIFTSTYKHPELGTISSLMAKEGGKYTILSTGIWHIMRGGAANPAEEILIVKGELSLGLSGVAGETWVGIDGGANWKRAEDIPKSMPALPGAATFKISAKKGEEFEIYKYKSEIESRCCLVTVEGTFNLHDCAEIRYNDNVCSQKVPSKVLEEQRQFCGGVFVAPTGTFNMDGGAVRNCSAAFGGGVNVFGTFNMSGGQVRNNLAYNRGDFTTEGAGVRVRGGTFNMSGGQIAYNIAFGKSDGKALEDATSKAYLFTGLNAAKGAGIHNSANSTTNITGGEVSENVSQWGGGGIYAGGNGTGKLFISGSAKIVRNLATVGGGIFMNSTVKLTGGTIADNAVVTNTGSTVIGVTPPTGAGVYIQEYSRGNPEKTPMLFLGGNAKIDLDNAVYLQSNIILPDMDIHRGGGEIYIPIHISDRLTCEGKAMKMDIGFVTQGPAAVPNKPQPIKLVAFDYLNVNSGDRTADLQVDKFLFGKLDMYPTRHYRFAEYTEQPASTAPDHPKLDYFLVLEEKE